MLAVNVAAWLLYLVALIVLGRGVIKKMPSGRVDFSWAAFSVSPASTALIVQRRAANVFHKTQRFEPGAIRPPPRSVILQLSTRENRFPNAGL